MRNNDSDPSKPGRSTERHAFGYGYTVLEVMVALAVLTIGTAGVVAMQKTTVLGNARARDLGTANAIAATWAERLRADGLVWTEVAGLSNLGNTRWLNVVGTDFPTITGNEGQWVRPAADWTSGISYQANVQGLDTEPVDTNAEAGFCTNLRLTQMLPTMIRAEIRVFWLRDRGGGTASGKPLCDADATYLTDVGAARDRYHFVYLTTAVLRNDSVR